MDDCACNIKLICVIYLLIAQKKWVGEKLHWDKEMITDCKSSIITMYCWLYNINWYCIYIIKYHKAVVVQEEGSRAIYKKSFYIKLELALVNKSAASDKLSYIW